MLLSFILIHSAPTYPARLKVLILVLLKATSSGMLRYVN